MTVEQSRPEPGWRVGVDSGGTFTDVCLVDEASGAVRVWKVPSTPDDPSLAIAGGVVEGLRMAGAGVAAAVTYFGHGTTVATNTLIQHRGALTGLITTEGFRDLAEIGRQRRPHLYDLQADKAPVLVPRSLRLEVDERLRHDGRVERPLDEAQVRAAARRLRAAGARAVAVCFLYAYVDSAHERRVREIVEAELPDAFVTCSHEVAPEFREYERQLYGYIAEEEPIQAVTFRLEAVGAVRRAELATCPAAATDVVAARIDERQVWMAESRGLVSCPVYDRERLGPGHRLKGPAVVEQMDATTLLLPGQTAAVDQFLNLVIETSP